MWNIGSFSFERLHAPVRGAERFYVKWNCSLLMSKENQKTTSDFAEDFYVYARRKLNLNAKKSCVAIKKNVKL